MATRNPKVDAFIDRSRAWRAETTKLRSILLECGLGEELKWGKPCYTFQDGNVAIIQGFKDHCSLMFFKGSLLKDTHGVLVQPGANSQAGMRIEFTSAEQIKQSERVVRAYVAQAITLQKAGAKVDFKQKHELELPDELTAKLKKNPALAKAFRSLTPGRQRAYVLFIKGAKQSATRTARIEKHEKRILAGKGLDDRSMTRHHVRGFAASARVLRPGLVSSADQREAGLPAQTVGVVTRTAKQHVHVHEARAIEGIEPLTLRRPSVCISRECMTFSGMHRTTLVIDQRKLAKARKLLGTKGIKDTVERALDEVIAYAARMKAVEQLRTMDGLDLDDPKVTARAWR